MVSTHFKFCQFFIGKQKISFLCVDKSILICGEVGNLGHRVKCFMIDSHIYNAATCRDNYCIILWHHKSISMYSYQFGLPSTLVVLHEAWDMSTNEPHIYYTGRLIDIPCTEKCTSPTPIKCQSEQRLDVIDPCCCKPSSNV